MLRKHLPLGGEDWPLGRHVDGERDAQRKRKRNGRSRAESSAFDALRENRK